MTEDKAQRNAAMLSQKMMEMTKLQKMLTHATKVKITAFSVGGTSVRFGKSLWKQSKSFRMIFLFNQKLARASTHEQVPSFLCAPIFLEIRETSGYEAALTSNRASKFVMLLSNFGYEYSGLSPVSEAGFRLQITAMKETRYV